MRSVEAPASPLAADLDAPSARPTFVRYRVMAFLCALSFLTYFDRFCILRSQREIQRDLFISDGRMGFLLGAFWLAYGLFEIPGGWMGQRFGARATLTRIVLAWSLFTFLSGTAVGFWSLLTFRFLFGVGEAGAYPNMARIQSRWLPVRERARMGGVLWMFARWGAAFAPILIGRFLAGVGSPAFRHAVETRPILHALAGVASWRLTFWASGGLGLLWVAIFYPWFRDDPTQKRSVNAAELYLIRSGQSTDAHDHGRHTPPAVWRALFTSRVLWAIAVLYLCSSFGWSFFASWMPRFYQDVHGVSFKQSEWAAAAPLFCGGVSCFAGGWLSDVLVRRTGRRRLFRAAFPVLGYATAAAAMAGIPFVHTPAHAAALLCLANAAMDFGQGANWATIVDVGGLYAGAAAGFINMVGNMGNFIQPPLGQWIFHHWGWPALFATYSGAFLIAAGMWAFITPEKSFYDGRDVDRPGGFEVMMPACGTHVGASER